MPWQLQTLQTLSRVGATADNWVGFNLASPTPIIRYLLRYQAVDPVPLSYQALGIIQVSQLILGEQVALESFIWPCDPLGRSVHTFMIGQYNFATDTSTVPAAFAPRVNVAINKWIPDGQLQLLRLFPG